MISEAVSSIVSMLNLSTLIFILGTTQHLVKSTKRNYESKQVRIIFVLLNPDVFSRMDGIQILPDGSTFWSDLDSLGYQKTQFFFPGFPGGDNMPVTLDKLMHKVHLRTNGFIMGLSGEHSEENGCHRKVTLNYRKFGTDKRQSIQAHIKSVPLLDIIEVLKGKYLPEKVVSCLPSREREFDRTYEKINDSNNQAYVDCLAGYVMSTLEDKCPGFPKFYGHFTGLAPKLRVDITEDFYSIRNEAWFHRGIGDRFTIEVHDEDFDASKTGKCLREIHITDEEFGFTEEMKELAETPEIIAKEWTEEDSQKNVEIEEVYVAENMTHGSGGTPVSHGSVSGESEQENETDDEDDDVRSRTPSHHSGSRSVSEGGDEDGSDSDSEMPDEGMFFAIIPNMPVQSAIYESLCGPIDILLNDDEVSQREWMAILFQVCFSLAVAQKEYGFVHNDLHTNNVMWVETKKKYITYRVNDSIYRVPTYGKIIKIIDYGRAYYKYKEREYLSDAYRPKGDAAGQYNYPPYFNPKETRVPPNPSFDLPRLACSLYEALFEPDDDPDDNALSRMLNRWLIDNRGKNILWNRHGEERFCGFLLYKHIARHCLNSVPADELENKEFRMFKIKQKTKAIDYVFRK